jgi:hypothetical protein
VNRVFYSNEFSAIGEYFTELNLLLHLADDDEMHHMMFGCFMEEDFYSAPYSENKVETAHECMHVWDTVFGSDDEQLESGPGPEPDDSNDSDSEHENVRLPPPLPVNDFGALFRGIYEQPTDNSNNIEFNGSIGSNEPIKKIV